ncbi:MAG: 2-amino-4-hydroxy-6-hydroxymethyldihydropteridine diphosphokinase [Magnetococcales bacterium]|nr:2-amino-4-hydroxy-6-hydroxymethyldihydropteridine diphosphokinase [Magnetococcales bacterium]MBF0151429.1 2-amino-4-hydroxy-6-hydroxymethyldihydropteridine diphosphokinase [Magnetococcales bacterium]MBF0174389.1 2-amino-4-hydroxy-6-hydroxymethyldihydropteridine diphosphokinase [Magnetococcales bacterium]MBF0348801.1 2-amino-4-hydroxy-6-hydroxymethyldihydropteridine diphosphokinase [Magnetococcales bacterium]MBF0632787.1 2-amino-4-hydroxy-6-hydroxymethyldihydropteridine diphosphokinase [Magne
MVGQPVLIAFGSNIDPVENLHRGLNLLHQRIGIRQVSTVWRTQPLPDPDHPGMGDQGSEYCNGVVLLHENANLRPPLQLRHCLREIEHQCGRVRGPLRYAPRPLDLDIILMGSLVFAAEGCLLPDPDLLQRPFVAVPCAELLPDLIHPSLGLPLLALAQRFPITSDTMRPDPETTRRLSSIAQQMVGVP